MTFSWTFTSPAPGSAILLMILSRWFVPPCHQRGEEMKEIGSVWVRARRSITWTTIDLTQMSHERLRLDVKDWGTLENWHELAAGAAHDTTSARHPRYASSSPSARSSPAPLSTLYSGSPRWGWIMNVTRHMGQRWRVCEGANSSLIST